MILRRCPVCGIRVDKTHAARIEQHLFPDTRATECPGSYQPYALALAGDRRFHPMTVQEVRELWWDEPLKPGPKSQRYTLGRSA